MNQLSTATPLLSAVAPRLLAAVLTSLMVWTAVLPTSQAQQQGGAQAGSSSFGHLLAPEPDPESLSPWELDEPWDFSPYRVQIWLACDDPRGRADRLAAPLHEYLDRDFSAVWRLGIADAPGAVRIAASRNMAALNYESVTAADPVFAIKRDHEDAPRIRFISDVGRYVQRCLGTEDRITEVVARASEAGAADLGGAAKVLQAIDGDALAVVRAWAEEGTEAILTSRGMALGLRDPEAKLIAPPIPDLVTETIDRNDKLMIVHIDTLPWPWQVSAVEVDCLMRHFSVVHRRECSNPNRLAEVVGRTVSEVFAPNLRIEDAGQKSAVALVRAGGLIIDEESPARVRENDVFVPMLRKNDRNGDPLGVGPLDWAYLLVKQVDQTRVDLDYHAGKPGGLQGRKNKRTFRTATRVRPFGDHTMVRLHAKGNPNQPLIGYEFYDRELDGKEMTFAGRADWDGRLRVEKTDAPLRLLYVKNGGAVLAKLPVVAGHSELEVADLVGDDQRLRAEAYVRGTENLILDSVAIRQILAARIRRAIEQDRMADAEELLEELRATPSYEKIAGDMGRKLVQLQGRNRVEQMKIDQMFARTREVLVKSINPQIIRQVGEEVMAAKRGEAPPTANDDGGDQDAESDDEASSAD